MRRVVALGLLLAAACSRAVTPPVTVSARRDVGPIRALAVMPATASPASRGDLSAEALPRVSQMLLDVASRQGAWSIVDPEKVRVVLISLANDATEARAGALAARFHADAALTATVTTYHDRVGSDYGVSEPASVSIQFLLVPNGQKEAAWKADYTFAQEPLTYNLLNVWGLLRGGLKWLTADELARIGVEEAVKKLASGSGIQASGTAP